MRLLITTDTVGGVWTFTQELTTGLLAAGHAVALVSLGRVPSEEQRAWAAHTRLRSRDRFTYTGLDTPLEWMQENGQALASVPTLLHLAESFQADLIHSNQFCFGSLATGLPVLITAHSDVLSWAEACHAGPLAPSPWLTRYQALVRRGLGAAAAVVAPTRWMLEALAQHFALPAIQQTIANGRTLDSDPNDPGASSSVSATNASTQNKTEPTLRQMPSRSRRKLQAVTAGRLWDEGKNIALLTQITSPIPLILAGETFPPDARTTFTATGHLPQQALFNLFAESAIYLCPSRYEPFGLAPLEAALCGCALVLHDLPSLRETWQDAALYFTDPASLQILLQDLAGNPATLLAAQYRAYQQATRYTRTRMTQSYLSLYQDLLVISTLPSTEVAVVAA